MKMMIPADAHVIQDLEQVVAQNANTCTTEDSKWAQRTIWKW